jgi:hypothetical protein
MTSEAKEATGMIHLYERYDHRYTQYEHFKVIMLGMSISRVKDVLRTILAIRERWQAPEMRTRP